MLYDSEYLANDLKKLGVQAGDIVLMHSGFRNIHAQSVACVIEALQKVLTPDGTLVMPSFPGGSEFFMVQSGMIFDINTRSSECGIITEYFRKRPDVKRSLNPGHCMAAWGKERDYILAGHEKCKVSAGWGSPFEKIIQKHGKILLVGVTNNNNTTLHYVENTHGAPTVCGVEYFPKVITEDNRCITVPTFPHMPGLPRDYSKVESILEELNIQQRGKFGDAEARLIDAYKMNEVIGKMIEKDRTFLIKPFDLKNFPQTATE